MAFDVVSFAAGKKSGGSGGGSGDIKTQPLNVTENGTYTAPSGRAYTPVHVDVKQPDDYIGEYDITPSENPQTLKTADKKLIDDITINPIPDQYIIPAGTLRIEENGQHNISQYEFVDVSIPEIQVEQLTITENGTYTPQNGTAYGPVYVTVSSYPIATDEEVDAALDELFPN